MVWFQVRFFFSAFSLLSNAGLLSYIAGSGFYYFFSSISFLLFAHAFCVNLNTAEKSSSVM